jgi:uncharacterized membrane protein
VKIGNRLAPLRFLLFLAVLPAAFFAYRALSGSTDLPDTFAMTVDAAALVFLASLAPIVGYADAETMRVHAAENDANRGLILVLTTLLVLAVLAAITGAMGAARDGEPVAIAKLIATLLIIWVFANTVYALHYAHAWYRQDARTGSDTRGLDFPGTETPTYGDFAYFAFTLGMTFQTSDVAITAPALRRAVLLHSFGAFLFNIGVIAFAINVLGGAG